MNNTLLIFGGKSFEHDISIITALIVYNKCKGSSLNLLPVYISKQNEWFYYGKDDLSAKLFHNFDGKAKGFYRAGLKVGENKLYLKRLKNSKIEISGAINCCHGGMGEDGSLVCLLEACKIPTTSFGQTGMGICMDKLMSKLIFKALSLPVVDYFSFTKEEANLEIETILEKANKLGYPLILKPANLGSSIGLVTAKNQEEFLEGIKTSLEFDSKVLVEKELCDFNEYNIACLRVDNKIIVSPIDCPKKSKDILSFEDKYIGKGGAKSGKKLGAYLEKNEFEIVSDKIKNKIETITKKVYQALGLGGVVRVDFIEKNGRVYLNEINTVPGSLGYYFFVPKTFKSMPDFAKAMLKEAENNLKNKDNIKAEYITKLI